MSWIGDSRRTSMMIEIHERPEVVEGLKISHHPQRGSALLAHPGVMND
jgi:hypothetical protein